MSEKNGNQILDFVTYKISSPTTVWFSSLYFFGLLAMIINNLFREGFSIQSIATAPEYYASLFLNYGLNLEGTYDSPWQYGFRAWLIAPFIAIWMGLVLYYLRDSGFAYNANSRNLDPFLPAGDPFYAFFNDNVYGAGELLFGTKGNMFYISIVWMPIIFASITTIMYSRKSERESWIMTRLLISFLIALWLGIQVAKVTDPNLSFSVKGFFESLFVDRRVNSFVVYDGQYHPTMLTFVFALYQFIASAVMALIAGSIALVKEGRKQYELYQKRQEYIREKQAAGITKLPWEEDAEQNGSME